MLKPVKFTLDTGLNWLFVIVLVSGILVIVLSVIHADNLSSSTNERPYFVKSASGALYQCKRLDSEKRIAYECGDIIEYHLSENDGWGIYQH